MIQLMRRIWPRFASFWMSSRIFVTRIGALLEHDGEAEFGFFQAAMSRSQSALWTEIGFFPQAHAVGLERLARCRWRCDRNAGW